MVRFHYSHRCELTSIFGQEPKLYFGWSHLRSVLRAVISWDHISFAKRRILAYQKQIRNRKDPCWVPDWPPVSLASSHLELGLYISINSRVWVCPTQLCNSVLRCVQLCVTPWTVAYQAPLSMWFSRQECWSGLPCPPLGSLPDLGMNLYLLHLLHWQVGSLALVPPGNPH